jgi:hypothetical protein
MEFVCFFVSLFVCLVAWLFISCAAAGVVSRRLPTAATQVRARVNSCGVCGKQRGTGAGFLRVLRFHLPLIHSTESTTDITIITQGWHNRPINCRSNSELGSNPAIYN